MPFLFYPNEKPNFTTCINFFWWFRILKKLSLFIYTTCHFYCSNSCTFRIISTWNWLEIYKNLSGIPLSSRNICHYIEEWENAMRERLYHSDTNLHVLHKEFWQYFDKNMLPAPFSRNRKLYMNNQNKKWSRHVAWSQFCRVSFAWTQQ